MNHEDKAAHPGPPMRFTIESMVLGRHFETVAKSELGERGEVLRSCEAKRGKVLSEGSTCYAILVIFVFLCR